MADISDTDNKFHTGFDNSMGNLADHFLNCAKLGRYLTVESGSRFIITDDFRGDSVLSEAAAMAAIYSKDQLVAEAALLPLSQSIPIMSIESRDKYERLFHLIEEQTLDASIKDVAGSLIRSRFRAAEIRALEAELGNKISPARIRYRDFLLVVKQLMDKEIIEKSFLDEFRQFTQDVAGKLDFGIYSFCLDSICSSQRISDTIKKLLALELLNYPTLIRRELISNIVALPGQSQEIVSFISNMLDQYLNVETVVEIKLLKDLKLNRFSMQQVTELVENTSSQ